MIAAVAKIVRHNGLWVVPSQSKAAKSYLVNLEKNTCTCEDFATGTPKCKHMWAAEVVSKREGDDQFEPPAIHSLQPPVRKTYRQNWPAYNKAQINEKSLFKALLFDLCRPLTSPVGVNGRPRIPLADITFAAVFKVYSAMSARRFIKELDAAKEQGYISREICYNSMLRHFYYDEMTTTVRKLIEESSYPLVEIESEFAVDSTGFPVSRYVRWFDEKYGKERTGKHWVKVHAMAGVKTHVITSVDIKERSAGDAPFFGPLLKEMARNFKITEVPADKACLSHENLEAAAEVNATAFIPFKANNVEGHGELWDKMLSMFRLHRDEFMAQYHKRSNVETAFHMIKAKFDSHVRSKTETAMRNEVLAKILCHNICCLIQAQFELGIAVEFWTRMVPPNAVPSGSPAV